MKIAVTQRPMPNSSLDSAGMLMVINSNNAPG